MTNVNVLKKIEVTATEKLHSKIPLTFTRYDVNTYKYLYTHIYSVCVCVHDLALSSQPIDFELSKNLEKLNRCKY